jgi:hypothetical protein
MNKLLRDPLSHFLAIGLVLFALSFWLGGSEENPSRVIHLSAGDESSLDGHAHTVLAGSCCKLA